MTTLFPQFAKTSDPRVIQAIEQNIEGFHEFNLKCSKVAEKYTGDPTAGRFNGSRLRDAAFVGLSADKIPDVSALPGRWKKPERGVIMPYKSNPVSEEFEIRFESTHIPGRGNLHWGEGRIGTGQLFVHDGAAYSHFSFQPQAFNDMEAAEMIEHGWVEIMPSAYHAALESVQASEAVSTKA